MSKNNNQLTSEFQQELLSSLDRDLVLRRLLTRLIEEFEVERGSIWTIESDEAQYIKLLFSINKYGAEDHISHGMRQFKEYGILLGVGYVGLTGQCGEPSFDNNPRESNKHYREVDEKMNHITRNIITIPLARKDRIIGVLQLLDRIDDVPFDDKTLNRLLEFAPWATIALDNVNAYAELSDLSETMAHTVKGVLGSARFRLKHIAENLNVIVNPEMKTVIESIDGNMKRCIKLLESHLITYKITDKEQVEVISLVQSTINNFNLHPSIEIVTLIDTGLPKINIEKETAIVHFLELLSNATNTIKTGIKEGNINKGKIKITGQVNREGNVQLRFINNGVAIARADQASIFKKYFTKTGNNEMKGSGLGLWGARKFLERQGGSISLEESNENQTVFLVTLPPYTLKKL